MSLHTIMLVFHCTVCMCSCLFCARRFVLVLLNCIFHFTRRRTTQIIRYFSLIYRSLLCVFILFLSLHSHHSHKHTALLRIYVYNLRTTQKRKKNDAKKSGQLQYSFTSLWFFFRLFAWFFMFWLLLFINIYIHYSSFHLKVIHQWHQRNENESKSFTW